MKYYLYIVEIEKKMAKGNNTDKSKRSHIYKPYDASNSSFVKRITSKVTEILPGPSWISRWLSPAPQLSFRQDRDDEDEEEDEKPQPPVKRIRLETSINDYTHQNHVQRLNDLQEDAESLSPITRVVDHQDGAVAGPSGLQQLGRPNFVSSTPAVVQNPSSVINKATNCDDGSDSSESTSGCSSLVPQAERTAVNSTISKINTNSPTHKLLSSSTGGIRRLSTSKDKYSKLNLSSSIVSRPSFDTYVFHNPHNKSMNSSQSSQLDDSSPFYRGRTMYGGASASRETLMCFTSPASRPRITSVKPVITEVPERDTIGTSALRILRALEQVSTPVQEAKKMPINETLKRRKPIQPFEELAIPQMPALLRIKRKRYEEAASTSGANETRDTTDSEGIKVVNQSVTPSSQNFEKLSAPPTYSIRKEETNKCDKFTTSIKGRNTEILENQRVEEVNLPNVKLDITSLPTFSLPTVKKPPTVTAKSPSPVVNVRRSSSTETNTGLTQQNLSRTTMQFKFSEPLVESTNGHSLSSIVKPTFKFSKPLDADHPSSDKEIKTHNSKNNISTADTSFKQEPNRVDLTMKMLTSNPSKLKRKVNQEEKSNVSNVKPFTGLQTGSIMDFFNKNKSGFNETEKSASSKISSVSEKNENNKNNCSPSEKSKLNVESKSLDSSGSKWSCKKCFHENNNADNCIKCGISKNKEISKDKEDSSNETVKCKTCSSTYKISEKNCKSCSEKKTETLFASNTNNNNNVTSSSNLVPLTALFKKKEGSWECDVCLVSNSGGDSCVSCGTPKPGAAPKVDSLSSAKPTFSFGIPSATTNPTSTSSFKFGFENSNTDNKTTNANNNIVSGFKFGSTDTSKASTTLSEFKFGSFPSTKGTETKVSHDQSNKKDDKDVSKTEEKDVRKKEEKDQEEPKSSTAKLFSFGNVTSNDKKNETKEETTKDAPPAKKVTFSQQLVEEKTISSEDKSIPTTTFSFTAAVPAAATTTAATSTKSETQNTTATFSFTPKAPLFNVPSSTSENNPLTSSIFKFGSSSTTAATVTTTSTDNTTNVTSTVSSSSAADNEKTTTPSFGLLSNSTPKSVLSTTDSTKKIEFFGSFGNTNKTSQFNNNVATPFMFGSSASGSSDKSGADKEEKKEGVTNSFFGEKRDSEQPPTTFFNAKSQSEEKYNIFENIVFGGGSNKGKEWNTKPVLPGTTSTATLFGSATTPAVPNSTETKSELFTFNATSTQPPPANSIPPFVFKGNDASENKTTAGGFSFSTTPSNNNNNNNNSNNNNTQLQSSSSGFPPSTQNTPRMFCPVPPMFSNNPAPPTTQQPPSSLFSFGANQQNPGGFFGFSAGAQVPAPSASATMGESTFSFGSQNVVPLQSSATPAAPVPPTFDPNIKPNFNFSGGTTPSFSATSSTTGAIRPGGPTNDRKIRKAVRRTIR